jgi:hypothetical protein
MADYPTLRTRVYNSIGTEQGKIISDFRPVVITCPCERLKKIKNKKFSMLYSLVDRKVRRIEGAEERLISHFILFSIW